MQKNIKNNYKEKETTSFIKEVAKYFMEFLDTDFKKRRIPKRNSIQKCQSGLKVAFDLEKYPNLKKDLLKFVTTGVPKDVFELKKGVYTTNVPRNLLNLITKKIKNIPKKDLDDVIKKIVSTLEELVVIHDKEYDKFIEESKDETKKLLAKNFILPLLDDLDKPLENLELADDNTKFQLEVEIVDFLFSLFEDKYTEISADFFLKPQKYNLSKKLHGSIILPEIKENLTQFFEDFATNDAFHDLHQIHRNNQLIDKSEIYLYFYELSLGNEKFPVFYLPIGIIEKKSKLTLTFDKRVFVNTKAIDFVVQEFNEQFEKKDNLAGKFERILYLSNEENFSVTLESIIRKLENFFELNRNIDIKNPTLQKGVNLLTSLSNKSYVFLFDKSDEALINDYEEILDNEELLNGFSFLINGFVEDNPKSLIESTHQEWDEKTISEKLTVESPIPLNDEQKQVLIALQKSDCKYLILEGPPGTGKSHTITAIICKALLEEKSVLVLSDKKEALDVVEDKISETLNKVRHEDDFQNPILRLGKTGNKFYQIVSGQAISKIRDHYRAYNHKKEDYRKTKNLIMSDMESNIRDNINFYEGICMDDINFYFSNNKPENALSKEEQTGFEKLQDYLESDCFETEVLTDLIELFHVIEKAKNFLDDSFSLDLLKKFEFEESNSNEALDALQQYVESLEELKWPLVGYFFQKDKIKEETRKFKNVYHFFDILEPEKSLLLLCKALDFFTFIYSQTDTKNVLKVLSYLESSNYEKIKTSSKVAKEFLKNEKLKTFLKLRNVKNKLETVFQNQPVDTYSQAIHETEDLVTAEMTHFVDQRIIEYIDKNKNEAETLKGIIRKKEKFPKDLFTNLKKAFPCILAGIRDYAEFIPLEKDLFDLIIIDEASQVSIAQALPALIRGKQVVILGDDKQFSNVKSNNASNVSNQQYKSKVKSVFCEERLKDSEDKFGWVNKVKENFDIKNSILKFTHFIRNYECLLKKHFRCYPEIISYSDKHFYNNNLQAMKIRGKSINEVIRFDLIEHDGKLDLSKNTNELEVDFIVKKLKEFKNDGIEQSLGIITPHREQVSLLWEKINNLPEKDWLFGKCKLKIMTFDTCQGEERDYIFYSLVATKEKDQLNYIFPVLRDEESLGDIALKGGKAGERAQRLNVGFSRAKECIHFVLSKPIEEFTGEIKNALLHYNNELELGKKKIIGGTDKKSGMEHKVQKYFYETKFYKENKNCIEFIPGFELGKHLRQLDSTYKHPDYKVDFLLIFENQKIVIEYDGFKEHFINRDEVNEINYSYYMKDDDVYRQKILEGYGYKFLRINKFNLGEEPVEILSGRLENIVKKKPKIRKF